MKSRRTWVAAPVVAVLVAATAACGSSGGDADGYPSGPVHIVVPYPAGGGLDIAARSLAPCFQTELGVSVRVENRAGGSGAVGTSYMLSTPADGQTLGMGLTSSIAVTPQTTDVGYGLDDIAVIGQVQEIPYVIVVNPGSPLQDFDDLVEALDSQALTAAAPGAASQGEIELRLMAEHSSELTIVPFDGSAGVKTAVLGGNVDIGVVGVDEDVLGQHENGTMRILASTGPERVDYMSDVATLNESEVFAELGSGTSYLAMLAPAETDTEVQERLSGVLETCLADETVRETIGVDFVADDFVDGGTLWDAFDVQREAYAPLLASQ